MPKACPILTCDAPWAFADNWWKPLHDIGYRIQFFRYAVSAMPPTSHDFVFSELPTAFGGRIYLGEKRVGGVRIEIPDGGHQLEVEVAVYGPTAPAIRATMLASGCISPRIGDFRFQAISDFGKLLGGYCKLYTSHETSVSACASALDHAGYCVVFCKSAKQLKSTCLLGHITTKQRWSIMRRNLCDVLLTPSFDLTRNCKSHVLGFSESPDSTLKRVLHDLTKDMEEYAVS